MRRLALAGVSLVILTACGPGVAPLTDEDIAALDALRSAYTEAVLAGDADAQAAQFTEDALWLGADAPAIQGRAAIRAAHEPDPSVTVQEFTITSLEIDGYGDLAFDHGTWSQTYVAEGMAEPVTVVGKYVTIVRKQDDGSWRWAVDIWNSDAPMPRPE